MKKFSINFLKVIFLLIVGVCMLGVISQVHAVEMVKADLIIEEETIELSKGETKSFTYAFDVVKVDGEICMRLNEDYTLPGAYLTNESTTEIKSENTQIATVDEFGKITGVNKGNTTIICEVSTEWEGKDMVFYDEVIVNVIDLNDEADDSAADLPGLEGIDFGETANGIISVVNMLLGWLGEILASINWEEVGSAVMEIGGELMGMLSGITNN